MMASPVTYALFGGALYFVLRLQNYRWRLLASSYASDVPREVKARRRFATIVATGGAPFFTHYVGVTVEVCEGGLSLRLVPPLSVQAPRLFLPFEDMTIRRTSWHLNAGSFSITMTRGGGVDLIVDDELFGWMQRHAEKLRLAA